MERKPHARRRLNFDDEGKGGNAAGPNDADLQYINSLEEEMRKDLQAAIDRWNFDFSNDVPLEGQWVWEPVVQAEPREEQVEPQTETDKTPEH
jgi:Cyclin-dependent kinase inhibitor.